MRIMTEQETAEFLAPLPKWKQTLYKVWWELIWNGLLMAEIMLPRCRD